MSYGEMMKAAQCDREAKWTDTANLEDAMSHLSKVCGILDDIQVDVALTVEEKRKLDAALQFIKETMVC